VVRVDRTMCLEKDKMVGARSIPGLNFSGRKNEHQYVKF